MYERPLRPLIFLSRIPLFGMTKLYPPPGGGCQPQTDGRGTACTARPHILAHLSLRTSDRCHWCGNPQRVGGFRPKSTSSHFVLRAPRRCAHRLGMTEKVWHAALAPSLRADFPASGENVREADKRGAGPAGLSSVCETGGVKLPPSKIEDFCHLPQRGRRGCAAVLVEASIARPLVQSSSAAVIPSVAEGSTHDKGCEDSSIPLRSTGKDILN